MSRRRQPLAVVLSLACLIAWGVCRVGPARGDDDDGAGRKPDAQGDGAEALADELVRRQRADGTWSNRFTASKEDDPLVATLFGAGAPANRRKSFARSQGPIATPRDATPRDATPRHALRILRDDSGATIASAGLGKLLLRLDIPPPRCRNSVRAARKTASPILGRSVLCASLTEDQRCG